MSRSTRRYQAKRPDDFPVIEALTELVEKFPGFGLSKLFVLLRKADRPWNHKRVWRVYCDLKLNIRSRLQRRYKPEPLEVLLQPIRPNQAWSADFTNGLIIEELRSDLVYERA